MARRKCQVARYSSTYEVPSTEYQEVLSGRDKSDRSFECRGQAVRAQRTCSHRSALSATYDERRLQPGCWSSITYCEKRTFANFRDQPDSSRWSACETRHMAHIE